MFIGTNYSGFVVEQNKLADATGHNWTSIWLTPAAIAGAVLIAFILFFKVIAEIGPARSSLVTYLNTAIAVLLGVIILREPLTVGIIVGLPLVLVGSYLASKKTA